MECIRVKSGGTASTFLRAPSLSSAEKSPAFTSAAVNSVVGEPAAKNRPMPMVLLASAHSGPVAVCLRRLPAPTSCYALCSRSQTGRGPGGKLFATMDVLLLHRVHFAFTVTFHYLFPQLTMGLALLIVVLKTLGLIRSDERYSQASRFWARILAINFVLGVVTGIPMEFQFGTNCTEFARRTGGVIGQPLAMEGIFSFFLESTFLGLFLFGEKRLSRWQHWGAAFMVFVGSWISGFFIVVTDAWMQHPVAYRLLPNGSFEVTSFWGLLLNPWAWLQYAHTMCGSVVTAAFVMSAVGALYGPDKPPAATGELLLRVRLIAGLLSCIAQIFPTGDLHGRNVARYQPAAIAGMEGLFRAQTGAPIVLLGQPHMEQIG